MNIKNYYVTLYKMASLIEYLHKSLS